MRYWGYYLGQDVHTHVHLTKQCNFVPAKAGVQTGTPRHALALYLWSCDISWCLAEGYRNRDQCRFMGPRGLVRTFFTCFDLSLWTQGHNGVSKSHRLLQCTAKTNSSPTAWASNFHLISDINSPSFSSERFIISCTDFSHQQCSLKIVLSAAHCPDDFAVQYFQQHDSFLHRQFQTDVPTMN